MALSHGDAQLETVNTGPQAESSSVQDSVVLNLDKCRSSCSWEQKKVAACGGVSF